MRNVLGWVGRVLLTSGILLLLFVAYQLWGTGIYTARQQSQLRSEFTETLKEQGRRPTTTTAPSGTSPTGTTLAPSPTTTAPPPELPANGEGIAQLFIPKIGLTGDRAPVVVEGINVPDLRKGPGHYPTTPLPGEEGNASIAGHRTTYSAPFGDLDQLATGDEITVRTIEGTFRYKVNKAPFVVNPNEGSVLVPEPDPTRPGHNLATLTLTTCNPKYSAAERLIVQASLVLPPGEVPLPPVVNAQPDRTATIAGLEGDTGSRAPTILWGVIAALAGGAWWFLFHRYRRWYVWIAGAIPFLVMLFVFYTYLERLLPSNY